MAQSLGKRLKTARQEKGLDLEEVARVTKVQRRILEALEEDRVEELLDPAYAKIFLRNYAVHLGLDGPALVQEFLSGRGGLPEPHLKPQTEVTRGQVGLLKRPSLLAPAGFAVLGLIGAAFLGYLGLDLYRTLTSRPVLPETAASASDPAGETWAVPRSKPLRVSVEAGEEVWLQIKSDGEVIFQNTLSKGERETWVARRELEIWTGNAYATRVSLNGKPLGPLGRGVKKGIKITHRGLSFPE